MSAITEKEERRFWGCFALINDSRLGPLSSELT